MKDDVFYAALVRRMRASDGRFLVYVEDSNLDAVVGPGFKGVPDVLGFQGKLYRHINRKYGGK